MARGGLAEGCRFPSPRRFGFLFFFFFSFEKGHQGVFGRCELMARTSRQAKAATLSAGFLVITGSYGTAIIIIT